MANPRRVRAAGNPQALVWTFALVWLMSEHGWSAASAGALVTASQILGALGRIAAGRWSDRVGSRLGPIRVIAAAAAICMLMLAITASLPWSVAVLIVASVVTVSDNGLAFTAIAEIAGPFWSGRPSARKTQVSSLQRVSRRRCSVR